MHLLVEVGHNTCRNFTTQLLIRWQQSAESQLVDVSLAVTSDRR
jgi:hypothetical protein